MAYLSNIQVKNVVYDIAAKLDSKGQDIEETYSTKDEVAKKIADLVDSAPETLDTLKELSDALGGDPNFSTTISTKLGLKVDKEDNKSLVLDTEITKLAELNSLSTLDTAIADAKKAGTDAQTEITTHTARTDNPHSVTKTQVGLGNVTNDAQVKRSEMGANSGVATLDEQGLVPSSQLPSYVDDVIDVYATYTKSDAGVLTNVEIFSDQDKTKAITGESGKIYVDVENNYQFRWTGTQYVTVGAPTVLGEITGTAYDGGKGKVVADKVTAHVANTDNPHNVTKSQVGLGNVDNTADKDKPVSTALLTAINSAKSEVQGNLDSHTGNNENPHGVTKAQVGLGNVDNTSDRSKPISDATQTALNTKVDKEEGKSLSTNDYTTAEKTKLASIAENANNYTLPTASANTLGGIKVGTNLSISDGVLSSLDTTYSVVTTTTSGLMSSTDKAKLDNIEANANNYSLPTADSSTLGGVKIGDNINISDGTISVAVDSELSEDSTNAVLNKVVNSSINSINSSISSISNTIAEMSCVYGVRHYFNNSSPVLTRIGTPNLHATLPVQSLMKRCVLADDGTVVYYLDPNDSTKKADGTDAVLDGTDGQVMVEVPEHYRRCTLGTDYYDVEISLVPFTNAKKINKFYVSAYEAALDRTNLKLASVVNTTEQYRGGNNTSSWDGTYRSLLGMPVTDINTTTFHTYGTKRGTGWDMYEIDIHDTIAWLFYIEYATLNSLTAYNADLTTEGYHQGGLGSGVTTLPSGNWSEYNSSNPVIPCGTTNSLGNNSGIVSYTVIASDGESTAATEPVPSYRGIENPYAHIWKWTVGYMGVGNGTNQIAYRCRNRSQYSTSNLNSYYNLVGLISNSEGWVKTIVKNEYGDIIPTSVGAGDTTYFSDCLWESHNNGGIWAAAVGGALDYGSICGFGCLYLSFGFGDSSSHGGSRLCFCEKNLIIENL